MDEEADDTNVNPEQKRQLYAIIVKLNLANKTLSAIPKAVETSGEKVSRKLDALIDSLKKQSQPPNLPKGPNDESEGSPKKSSPGRKLSPASGILSAVTQIGDDLKKLCSFFTNSQLSQNKYNRDFLNAVKGKQNLNSRQRLSRRNSSNNSGWLLGMLTGLGGLLAGVAVGFVSEFAVEIAKFTKLVWKGLKEIPAVANFAAKANEVFKSIGKPFVAIYKFVRESKFIKGLGSIFGKIEEGFGFFTKPLKYLGKFLPKIGRTVMSLIGHISEPIALILKGVGAIGKSAMKWVPKLFNVGKTFGSLLGKIALPLTVIVALWDTVTGAMEGYKNGGLIGAVKAGLVGLLNSLLGWIIDIPKDILSWAATKMGFDGVAKWLDSWDMKKVFGWLIDGFEWLCDQAGEKFANFSFKEFYTSVKDSIVSMMDLIVNKFKGMGEGIMGAFDGAVDWVHAFHQKILQMILPRVDSSTPEFSVPGLIRKVIPDSVYEYAGLDPKTSQIKPDAASNPYITQSSSDWLDRAAKSAPIQPKQSGADLISDYIKNSRKLKPEKFDWKPVQNHIVINAPSNNNYTTISQASQPRQQIQYPTQFDPNQ